MRKTLVAYFSVSGVTAKLAKKLAAVIAADVYEIQPEVPYTSKDLNWMDKNSRSSKENNDHSILPAMKGHVENINQYDRIFVGFPIWWYREPNIIDSFLKNEDVAGKKIIPFATSGSSQIGQSGKNMQAYASDAVVYEGKRFSANASDADLKTWAEQY